MATSDGGAAFPGFERWEQMDSDDRLRECQAPVGGMSLRDYFAAAALTGLMSDSGLRPSAVSEFETMAMRIYQAADALLVERAK